MVHFVYNRTCNITHAYDYDERNLVAKMSVIALGFVYQTLEVMHALIISTYIQHMHLKRCAANVR